MCCVCGYLPVHYHPTFVYLLALCFREPVTEYDIDEHTRKDRDIDNRIFKNAIQSIIPGIESFDIYNFWSNGRPYLEPEIIEEILSNSDNETLRQAYQETIKILAVALGSIFLKQQYEGKKPTNKTLKSIKETIPVALLVWLSLRRNPKIYNWFNI